MKLSKGPKRQLTYGRVFRGSLLYGQSGLPRLSPLRGDEAACGTRGVGHEVFKKPLFPADENSSAINSRISPKCCSKNHCIVEHQRLSEGSRSGISIDE